MQTHLPMADQGALAGMHEFNWVLDGEDVTALMTIDPVDHGRQCCALAGTVGPVTSTSPLGLRPTSKHQEVAVLQG